VIGEDIAHSSACLYSKARYKKPEDICLCDAKMVNHQKAQERLALWGEQPKEEIVCGNQ